MEGAYDVFLCHNSADKAAVKAIGRGLASRGLRPWLDEWELRPGMPWQRQLGRQIETIRSAAVLVGKSGLGPWQSEELESFLQQFVKRGCPVIPVILGDCTTVPKLPVFLANRTWVDFRKSDPDPWDALIWGITGERPNRQLAVDAPEPTFLDQSSRDLSQALDEAYRRESELAARGEDPAEARREIVALKREMREDGLCAGDLLDGRYKLLEPIGQGGFARVWKAWDTSLRQLVALKALHQQYARDRTRRERFFRGAKRMARLSHPGITRILGEPELRDGACRFFVMEYAEGGDLRQAVLEGQLDVAERLRVVCAVGAALDYAHSQGIIHRDVKPANVLLDGAGQAKLTDFDLVRAQDSTGGTRTGMLGTVVYAAPEAMERAKEAGVAADVFGLGMTAIFALHGRDLPARELLRDAPGFARRLDAPEPVKAALARAVAWEPEERQDSVAELCAELADAEAVFERLEPTAVATPLPETDRPQQAPVMPPSLTASTLDERLEQAGDWRERSKIFRKIPELLESAEAALKRIDHLRRRTADIHDLFFLEQAAREVAERWPASARAVTRLRGRFYGDREPPPEDLFSWVETPLDGRVGLWRGVEAGRFRMGSPQSEPHYDEDQHPLGAYADERPQHLVEISQPFRLMAVPVTNAMYRAFDASHELEPWDGAGDKELWHHPVVNVDWYQATAFCRWLESHGFAGARLPTEAEWEYACRAGTSTRYWSGDSEEDLARVAWYDANASSRTHRVGEKPASPWGLYDMHGNVWEWCADGWDVGAYAKRIGKQPAIDPRTDEDVWNIMASRVLRGGAWGYRPLSLRAAYRGRFWRWPRDGVVGFRVCVSGPEHA